MRWCVQLVHHGRKRVAHYCRKWVVHLRVLFDIRPDTTTHEGDPHWDYNYRGSQTKGWRLRPDQMPELKN